MNAQTFILWYNETFRQDPLYTKMQWITEGSPWHRERNIAVHTDMVVSMYMTLSADVFDIRGALGCAFHDVGKPASMVKKYKEDRGHYLAFHGHELVSARMWENWAVKNWAMLQTTFGLVVDDIYTIGWMIEHHVPWATKNDKKLDAFATTAFRTLGHSPAWTNMLLADQYGRISDDSHQRYVEAHAWVSDHITRREKAEYRWTEYNEKTVYMLIGAPGSGKSTFRNALLKTHADKTSAVISMDDLRLEWYGGEYDEAWLKSTKDSSFNAKVDKVYVEALRENEMIVLDNTNTAAKARARWIAPARARNFRIVAVLFPVTLAEVKSRQRTRTDKTVPDTVVEDMYNRMSLPMYGDDFDHIIVVGDNLPS